MRFVTKMLYLVDKNIDIKKGYMLGFRFFSRREGGDSYLSFPGDGGGGFDVYFGHFYIVI